MSILKNYFDCIYCITSRRDSKRKQNFIKQTKELGIYEDITFHYFEENQPIEYLNIKRIQNRLLCENRKRELSCTISHYLCVKDAYQNNYNRILICEDDVYFLKNLNDIKLLLDNMPEDFDLIRFCWLNSYCDNFHYTKLNSGNHASAACYSLSKSGIKQYIDHTENVCLEVADWFGYIIPPEKFNVYYSNTHLAFPFDDMWQFKQWFAEFNSYKMKSSQNRLYHETIKPLKSSIWNNEF